MSNTTLILVLVCLFPFITYLSVKLGTFAYLNAKRRFEKENPK